MIRSIMATVRAVLSSFRFVWERGAETGQWVLRQVAGTVDGFFAPVPAAPDMSNTPYAMPELKRAAAGAEDALANTMVALVQKAAKELATGIENDETLSALPDKLIAWLSVMDRAMLCQIVCATPAAVREHLDGKGRGMQRVIACDREAIEMYVASRRRKVRQDDETLKSMLDDEYVPALA